MSFTIIGTVDCQTLLLYAFINGQWINVATGPSEFKITLIFGGISVELSLQRRIFEEIQNLFGNPLELTCQDLSLFEMMFPEEFETFKDLWFNEKKNIEMACWTKEDWKRWQEKAMKKSLGKSMVMALDC